MVRDCISIAVLTGFISTLLIWAPVILRGV